MRVVNKHPDYIKSSDRVKRINQAYTMVFRAINKIGTDVSITSANVNR